MKPSVAADVRVLTSGAPADIQRGLARDFSEKSGHRLVIRSGTLGAIQQRLDGSARRVLNGRACDRLSHRA